MSNNQKPGNRSKADKLDKSAKSTNEVVSIGNLKINK